MSNPIFPKCLVKYALQIPPRVPDWIIALWYSEIDHIMLWNLWQHCTRNCEPARKKLLCLSHHGFVWIWISVLCNQRDTDHQEELCVLWSNWADLLMWMNEGEQTVGIFYRAEQHHSSWWWFTILLQEMSVWQLFDAVVVWGRAFPLKGMQCDGSLCSPAAPEESPSSDLFWKAQRKAEAYHNCFKSTNPYCFPLCSKIKLHLSFFHKEQPNTSPRLYAYSMQACVRQLLLS